MLFESTQMFSRFTLLPVIYYYVDCNTNEKLQIVLPENFRSFGFFYLARNMRSSCFSQCNWVQSFSNSVSKNHAGSDQVASIALTAERWYYVFSLDLTGCQKVVITPRARGHRRRGRFRTEGHRNKLKLRRVSTVYVEASWESNVG